jgi:hypothetical protein
MFKTKVVWYIKTYVLYVYVQKGFYENCAVYEIIWQNMVLARQAGTDDNVIRRMRFACWIIKATNTHSEYVILTAFPWHRWLRERA